MANFLKNTFKNLGEGWIKEQMGTDESAPANVANKGHKNLSPEFTSVTSNGPWTCDAAKKGSGGTNDMGKIDRMADDHKPMVDAGK